MSLLTWIQVLSVLPRDGASCGDMAGEKASGLFKYGLVSLSLSELTGLSRVVGLDGHSLLRCGGLYGNGTGLGEKDRSLWLSFSFVVTRLWLRGRDPVDGLCGGEA